MVAAKGYPVEEITGGCFCCRFTSLTDAADRLTRDARPDVFLAEPVGSCTDLRATVQYPLRRMYQDNYRIAPLSVLVDPVRAARMLGLEQGHVFSAKVQYIYEKQLEEADIIVINKSDLLTPERAAALEAAVKIRFPQADVVTVSARSGAALETWFAHYDQFAPGFSWWTRKPYDAAHQALLDYAKLLREEVAGLKGKDEDPLVGDPIGRQALLDDLAGEMIAYSPEELLAIGEREFAWCETQLQAAAAEMGFGADWKAALAKVKEDHVEPGAQDALVASLAKEAIAFLDAHDLVTIPELCRETWRVRMIDRETQRNFPYAAYGGQDMLVAYPTSDMDVETRLMTMRGNNVHFSRIVVPHELIPGHHLQGFVAARSNTHRGEFSTPFLGEGWALYWELRLWDLGYARGPEDRLGMLFWRMHRAARIIVTLKFHLGQMQPQEMIDFLVDRVGHEKAGATSEVRRYIGGDYGPLYQCAYMVGGLQLRALHDELVGASAGGGAATGGRMTERQFHDAVLEQNSIPVEMIRAALTNAPLTRDWKPSWRFAGEVAQPSSASSAASGAPAPGR